MAEQKILSAGGFYEELDRYFAENAIQNLFLVCDNSLPFLRIGEYFSSLPEKSGVRVVRFSDFHPNPDYASVLEGVKLFRDAGCEAIVAVGGGSAIDVAKCVKYYAESELSEAPAQDIPPNAIPLLAVPTTAGTGSEATRFAVVYYNGEKQSIADESLIPSAVLFDPDALKSLPAYQRKATMLDAFCHAVESYWSLNSTEESRCFSDRALRSILSAKDAYLANEEAGNAAMLEAANLAGKAINLTETTAGHAMCYKLTSFYHIAHGHAAALCLSKLWPYMLGHPERCIDPRGEDYLDGVYSKIATAMGCASAKEAVRFFQVWLDSLALPAPKASPEDLPALASSVNPVRLRNHPVALDREEMLKIYREMLLE